ncbi:MAG: hypothetical protein U0939_18710 [Pirellulales bacterium]
MYRRILTPRRGFAGTVVLGIAFSLLAVGCDQRASAPQPVVATRPKLAEHSSADQQQAKQGERAKTASDAGPIDASPATRADLEEYLKRFKAEQNWTFGERTPGELSGTWTPDDRSDARRTFNVDGVDGTYSETSFGLTVHGVYAVSEQGKVVAVGRGGGVSLGTHAQLQGGQLVGPKGPAPKMTWSRHEPPGTADAHRSNPR